MLVMHLAHLFEEIWGRFRGIEILGGLGWFLALNLVIFCVVIALFYFVLNGKRWAYYTSMVYAGIMVLNGVVHNLATTVTGVYFEGYAGGYTGIGLIIVGSAMLYYLCKEIPSG